MKEALGERELFNAVSGLNISADNEADFLAEVSARQRHLGGDESCTEGKVSAFSPKKTNSRLFMR